jgi:hypothetical protein
MSQYVINIGALPNDGTGDPLRTAFNEVNLNFNQVFAAGPVLSNIQIANNAILTTNTNGNLVLAPNGIGVVQSNVSIVPNTANIRNLGAADRRWSTVYVQYANVSGALAVANLTATGNVTVGGNLSVTGNIVYIGNLITDAKTIQLANTAGTANAASGSGITVGANDNIATMLYSSAANAWTFNIGVDTPNLVVNNISSDDSTFVTVQDGLDVQGDITADVVSVTGNVTASYFIGNGSQLTGLYGNSNVATFLAGFGSNTISTTGNVTVGNILPAGYVSATGNVRGANFNTDGTVSAVGNVTGNYFIGNGNQLTGIVSSYGNANVVANLAALGSNPVSTTGNVTGGNLLFGTGIVSGTGNVTGNYFIGNGSQLTGLSTSSISNGTSNVSIATANGNPTVTSAGNTWTFGGPQPDALYWPDGSFQSTAFVGQALDLVNTGNASITSNSTGNTTYVWTFGDDGRLTFPGTPRIDTGSDNFEVQAAENINLEANVVVNIYTDTSGNAYQWQFGDDGSLTFPIGISIDNNVDPLYPKIIADSGKLFSVQGQGNTGSAALAWSIDPNVDSQYAAVGVNRGGGDDLAKVVLTAGNTTATLKVWKFDQTGNLTLPGNMIVNGNINTMGTQTALLQPTDDLPLSFIASGANGSVTSFWAEDFANLMTSNIAAIYTPLQNTQTVRIVTGTNGGNIAIYDFDPDGMFTAGAVCATGNVYAGNVSTSGNVTGNYILGNGSQLTNLPAPTVAQDITSNGAMSIMTYDGNLKYVSYATVEPSSGNITGGNISAIGNITGNYFIGNGSQLTGVAGKTTGTWNVIAGTDNYSFTVPINNTYQLWVNGNIPNGIIIYNATVSVSNTNVPVIGQQFAWNYEGGGNILMFTSIPAQIIGTAGAISNAQPAVANTNVFTFSINNTSGNTVTVNYGWAQIS